MPFPFELPTTSSISFDDFYTSTTHPSLPLAATTCRGVLRDVLKKHKRLPPPSQTSDLPAVATALNEYIPHLSALDAGLSNSSSTTTTAAANEAINVVPRGGSGELAVEWRATLTAPQLPGRDPPRIRLHGLRLELGFALASLAYAHSLQARAALHALHNHHAATAPPSPEQRTAAVAAAMRAFLEANAIHSYLVQRLGSNSTTTSSSSSSSSNATTTSPPPAAAVPPPPTPQPSGGSGGADGSGGRSRPSPAPSVIPPDMTPGVQTALAELTLAEATLIAVLKDDPYPAVVAEDRSRASRDWMFKAPDIPRVRAHLFARLCLAAAEHAARGKAGLGWASGGSGGAAAAGKVDEALGRYLEDLRRTARGKACRFFGIDAELEGKTGEGIAWLRAARRELGFASSGGGGAGGGGGGEEEGGKGRGFASRLKKDWSEKREDRRIEKGADWGSDAGRFEEGRVVDMLEKKWVKMNDTVGVQTIPPIEPLLASMPSGREYHSPKPYKLPHLDESTIARMRAPPPPNSSDITGGGGVFDADNSSSDEDVEESQRRAVAATGGGGPVGAFPGTSADYAADGGDRGYY